jgi:hypothetical protein
MMEFDMKRKKEVNLRPIGYQISRLLHQSGYETVSPDQFDHFVASYPIFLGAYQKDFEVAQLMLYHPTKATGIPMLQLLRQSSGSALDSSYTGAVVTGTEHFAMDSIWRTFVLTAQLLSRSGRHEDGCWVLDFAREKRLDLIGQSTCFNPMIRPAARSWSLNNKLQSFVPPGTNYNYQPGLKKLNEDVYRANKRLLGRGLEARPLKG